MESAVHQVASASIAAVFSVGMLLAAHLFTAHTSSRTSAVMSGQRPGAAASTRSRIDANSLSVNWRNGAI
jgi:hypothetical protein